MTKCGRAEVDDAPAGQTRETDYRSELSGAQIIAPRTDIDIGKCVAQESWINNAWLYFSHVSSISVYCLPLLFNCRQKRTLIFDQLSCVSGNIKIWRIFNFERIEL